MITRPFCLLIFCCHKTVSPSKIIVHLNPCIGHFPTARRWRVSVTDSKCKCLHLATYAWLKLPFPACHRLCDEIVTSTQSAREKKRERQDKNMQADTADR